MRVLFRMRSPRAHTHQTYRPDVEPSRPRENAPIRQQRRVGDNWLKMKYEQKKYSRTKNNHKSKYPRIRIHARCHVAAVNLSGLGAHVLLSHTNWNVIAAQHYHFVNLRCPRQRRTHTQLGNQQKRHILSTLNQLSTSHIHTH